MSKFFAVVLAGLLTLLLVTSVGAEEKRLWLESGEGKQQVVLNLPSFAPIVEDLAKSVVNISTEGEETLNPFLKRRGRGLGQPNSNQGGPNSPFDFFFQLPPQMQGRRSFRTHSLGSGFVINPDGYIITNNHVVEKATKIIVAFQNDKKTYEAEVVGRDRKTDVALLKVNVPDKKLTPVVLGNSTTLNPGDWVIAIGNPFRLGHSVTVGIVSALSRKVPGGGPYDDFIQTDASINPGNSGGPLFNAKGEVVGVNTAIYSPGSLGGSTGFNIGIGFATPINLVKGIVSQIREKGRVVRGWLGVLIQPVSEDVAQAMNLTQAQGALVADVLADSPAEAGGLKRGDVIVGFDGKEVLENDDLPLMVAETPVGKVVAVEVLRAGKRKKLDVKISELEEQAAQDDVEEEEESKLGLTVQDITPDIARGLDLESEDGVVVADVVPGSVAEEAGFRRGDVVLEVGSRAIASVKEFRKATATLEKDKPLLVLVRRGENTIFLTLKAE